MSQTTIAGNVSALFSDQAGARRLGERYLQAHPEEADIGLLITLLCGDHDDLSINGPRLLRRKLAQQRTADLVAGRITCLDGWILAHTEVRACALSALT